MIESIRFQNFKALKDATLKLGPLNVIVGPNGSGKTSILQAMESINRRQPLANLREIRTLGQDQDPKVRISWRWKNRTVSGDFDWMHNMVHGTLEQSQLGPDVPAVAADMHELQNSIRVYSLDAANISHSVQLQPHQVLDKSGCNLAGALDRLRDLSEESFVQLQKDLSEWMPEFDRISFDTPGTGYRSIKLRQSRSKHFVPAAAVSEGVLFVLALLTIINDPIPPRLLCLEEPERGLHPRLLRDLSEALLKLCYPMESGLDRVPVQIIVTTHSPYFLDTLKDHPEAIIVAEKQFDGTVTFARAADQPYFKEIVSDVGLGDAWYTGVLGGVPAAR
jgi:predicted ATPase